MVVNADVIWSIDIALEAVILVRGLATRLISKYRLFHLYIATILLTDIIRLCCNQLAPAIYPQIFWCTESLTILASYAVVVEIFRQSLQYSPGVARFTRMLLSIVFVWTLTFAMLDLVYGDFHSVSRTIADGGRYFRYVEGALLLVILWMLSRYRIRLGRNLLGILAGNAFWVGISIVNFAFWSRPGAGTLFLWRVLRATSYAVTLAIWCAALWTQKTDRKQPPDDNIERDYRSLAKKTQEVLSRTSDRLIKSIGL